MGSRNLKEITAANLQFIKIFTNGNFGDTHNIDYLIRVTKRQLNKIIIKLFTLKKVRVLTKESKIKKTVF